MPIVYSLPAWNDRLPPLWPSQAETMGFGNSVTFGSQGATSPPETVRRSDGPTSRGCSASCCHGSSEDFHPEDEVGQEDQAEQVGKTMGKPTVFWSQKVNLWAHLSGQSESSWSTLSELRGWVRNCLATSCNVPDDGYWWMLMCGFRNVGMMQARTPWKVNSPNNKGF